jgi:hypothetical protein
VVDYLYFMNVAEEPRMPQRKEAEMKGYNGPLIFCAALLFGTLLIAPAFAELKKADEVELAKAKASVTGASAKEQTVGIEKDMLDQEQAMLQASETFKKGANVSPSVSKESIVDTYISDHTANNSGFVGANSTVTGSSITPVKSH